MINHSTQTMAYVDTSIVSFQNRNFLLAQPHTHTQSPYIMAKGFLFIVCGVIRLARPLVFSLLVKI